MSEALAGRTTRRSIDRFALSWGCLVVAVAIVLFANGRWPDAAGVLLSPLPVAAMALRLRRVVRDAEPGNVRPSGLTTIAVVTAMPGVVLVFVGQLVGGVDLEIFSTAVGAAMIGTSALFIAIGKSFNSK